MSHHDMFDHKNLSDTIMSSIVRGFIVAVFHLLLILLIYRLYGQHLCFSGFSRVGR